MSKRYIDVDAAVSNAEARYGEWVLAMAAAEGTRQINMVYKKQELFKAVKKVLKAARLLTWTDCGLWRTGTWTKMPLVILSFGLAPTAKTASSCMTGLQWKMAINIARSAVQRWRLLRPMVKLEPCKDCPDRHPVCHDSCPKYAEYKRQLKAQRIYTSAHHAAERISRNDFDKEGWMGGRKR